MFDTLRREILAARLNVTLDEQLNCEIFPPVVRLSTMTLPPMVRLCYRVEDVVGDSAEPARSTK